MIWFAILAVLLAVVLPWAIAIFPPNWPPRLWWPDGAAQHLPAIQGILTITALIFGAGWFLIERPDAAKLEFEQTAEGVPLPDGRALVVMELKIKNSGRASLDLRQRQYRLFLQRVTPLPSAVTEDFTAAPAAEGFMPIRPADTWSLLAVLDPREPGMRKTAPTGAEMGTLGAFIEAGETENLYFRAIVPCSPDLRVYATFQMPKPRSGLDLPGREPLWWVKQTLVDLTGACGTSRQGPEP